MTLVPLTASAESGNHLGQQAVRNSLSTVSLSSQVFDLNEVCVRLDSARTVDFGAAESALVRDAIVDYPTPDEVDLALDVLSSASGDVSTRGMAVIATNRFFRGICGSDGTGGDGQRTACTLFVTLRVAQSIQVERLASQVHFALHNTGISQDLVGALSILSLPESDAEADVFAGAVDVMLSDMTQLCTNLPSASVTTATVPEALPATGLDDASFHLIRIALLAVAIGAGMLGLYESRPLRR